MIIGAAWLTGLSQAVARAGVALRLQAEEANIMRPSLAHPQRTGSGTQMNGHFRRLWP